MDPQGIHHRSTECELDHECDQEILEAIQKVYERLNQTGCKRYKLGHESDQVVQQTDQEQDNTRESVHSLDKIGSRESSGNEGSHESIVMKIQAMSIRRHYRGYTLPSNFRALDLEFRHHKWIWNFLHRRIVTVIIAAIDDAANNVDLPIEVPFLSCTSTLIPQKAGIIDPWSMDTREVAGGPCFFVLRGSRPVNGTATFVCMVSPEFDERLARSSQSTEYMQGKSSKVEALMNFDVDFFIVSERSLRFLNFTETRDKIRRLCLVVRKDSNYLKDSSNNLSPLTMRHLNRLTALDLLMVFVTNSEHARRPAPGGELVRYARGIKSYVESNMLQRVHPIQEFFRILNYLVIVVALTIASFLVSLFESFSLTSLSNRDGQHGKN